MKIETEEALLSMLDRLASGADDHALALKSAAAALRLRGMTSQTRLPRLTYAQFARRLIADRQVRQKDFDIELLGEAAWDILLDLFVAQEEARRISISSLCIAAGVPMTTALRWIAALDAKGLLYRKPDMVDRRKVYVMLSASGSDGMRSYLMRIARSWSINLDLQ